MKNQIKTILFLGILGALLTGFGSLMGKTWALVFLVLALAINLGAYFFSDRIILKMQKARELGSDEWQGVRQMVAELSMQAGIPTPKIYLIDEMQPNAFATGRNPSRGVVAFTTGILNTLTNRELKGVIAHELAHIKNRDTTIATIAAIITTSITYLANMIQFTSLFGSSQNEEGEAPNLLMAFIAPVAATLVQLGISRSREFLADEEGARICKDPEALAMALEKLDQAAQATPLEEQENPSTASLFIVNPFSGNREKWLALFSTHPATKLRVEKLRAMPAELFFSR